MTRAAPVFVVGAMRSGTTLLRLMLNEHPEVAIPAESHFLAPLAARFADVELLAGPALEEALAIVAGSPEWRRDFAHDEQALREAVGSGPLSPAELIDRVFRLEVGEGPRRWGDKTPAYLFRLRVIYRWFPDAQVVCMVRDPRDAYLSLASRGWVGTTPWAVGDYLRRCAGRARSWADRMPTERFSLCRYEDLVLEPEETLHRVLDALGLDFHERMLRFHEEAERNVQRWELDIGAHVKLLRPPRADDVGRWRGRRGWADRARLAQVEAVAHPAIELGGYDEVVPVRTRPALAAGARLLHQLASLRVGRHRADADVNHGADIGQGVDAGQGTVRGVRASGCSIAESTHQASSVVCQSAGTVVEPGSSRANPPSGR